MITSISIENFKGIRDRVQLDFRPITLLFGANSAGKSTVLHALHYAREVFDRHNLDADQTIAGGKYIDLGGFRRLVHRGDDHAVAVRELQQCLLPNKTVPIALVCKLGERWEKAASLKIAAIANHNHRNAAMAFFQRLVAQQGVTRPTVQQPHGDDEAGWIRAGMASAAAVPMDKIIVSAKSAPPTKLGGSLKDLLADPFWESFENPRLVGRDTASQERALRAICTHSEWLLLRLPQIRGGRDDEIVTVKQIIQLSNQLPDGFRKTAIDLHVCMHSRMPEEHLVSGISAELSAFVRQGVQIRLTIWPERHFVNRELLAGDFAKTSSGEQVPRPMWWITMTHVAVAGTRAANAGESANTWSLFAREKAAVQHASILACKPANVYTLPP